MGAFSRRGGITDSTPTVTNSSEIFDPTAISWTISNDMNNARFMHRATLMADGRVLVTGGSLAGHCNIKNTAEIFDPATGAWKMTSPMSSARSTHLSVSLDDGGVLVAGGWTIPVATCNRDGALESVSAEAEIFDPVSERWTTTGSMNVAHAGNGVFERLFDGRVLYAGGRTSNPGQGTNRTTAAELFDPATGTWSLVPDMASAHAGGSSVLLSDGRVMAVGGGAQFKLAELFIP